MNPIRSLAAAIALSLLFVASTAALAEERPIRVAVANVPRIFNDIQETKDLDARFQQERQRLAGEEKPKVDEITKLKAEGGNLRPDSPQFDEWRRRYVTAQANYKAWLEVAKADVDWRRKRQTRELYEKIYAATTEYADKNHIDLVLADHQPSMTDKELEQIPPEQLPTILNQRRVIYASKAADISDSVIALLDSKYKQGGAIGAGGGGGGPVGNAGPAGAELRGAPAAAQQQPQRRPNNR